MNPQTKTKQPAAHAGVRSVPLQKPSQKLDFIDNLRGIAILAIIFIHSSSDVKGLSVVTDRIAEYGNMGVQLFFVLSAYTLCLSAQNRRQEPHPIKAYYIRRFFRIAPMYYLGILLHAATTLFFFREDLSIFFSRYTPGHILANIFFIHGFIPGTLNNVVFGGWSIAAEMFFYLFFPFLFPLLKRLSRNSISIATYVCATFLLSYLAIRWLMQFPYWQQGSFAYFNLINQLPVFVTGMGYFFYKNGVQTKPFQKRIAVVVSFVFATCLLIAGKQDAQITLYPFACSLSFLLLLEIYQYFPKLSLPWLARIGQLSYSMYITHWLFAWYIVGHIARQLNKFLPAEISLLVCFGISVVTAYIFSSITEKLIESKGISIGKKIIEKLNRPKAVIPVSVVQSN